MKKNKNIITGLSVIGGITLALAGCSAASQSTDSRETTAIETAGVAGSGSEADSAQVSSADIPDGFSEKDFDTSYSDAQTVELSTGATKTEASGVTVEGNVVTFTQEGTYLLKGELNGGQIVADLPGENDKIRLVLDGVNITNTGSAGIYVKNADKVFVTTAEGSENSISVNGEFVQTDENNVDGAIYSKDDIVFNGKGSLTVSSEKGHGIVSKNDLKITSGSYEIDSASKALQGKDLVGIAGGDMTLNAGTDGIDSVNVAVYDGNIDIKAEDEGINADITDENTEPSVTLAGGKISIVSGDDGIQTTGDVVNDGADLSIISGGGSANAAEHYTDMAFGQMGGWRGRGQGGPQFGGDPDSLGEGLRQNMQAMLGFFRRMRKKIPNLWIENCSSGGHRLEPSLMGVTDMASFSDAHECDEIPIIAAQLHRLILPGQSQIWAALRAKDSIRRINYSLINTFLGVMCISGDVWELSEEQWAKVDEGISFFKEVRDIIRDGISTFHGEVSESWRHPEGWHCRYPGNGS